MKLKENLDKARRNNSGTQKGMIGRNKIILEFVSYFIKLQLGKVNEKVSRYCE